MNNNDKNAFNNLNLLKYFNKQFDFNNCKNFQDVISQQKKNITHTRNKISQRRNIIRSRKTRDSCLQQYIENDLIRYNQNITLLRNNALKASKYPYYNTQSDSTFHLNNDTGYFHSYFKKNGGVPLDATTTLAPTFSTDFYKQYKHSYPTILKKFNSLINW